MASVERRLPGWHIERARSSWEGAWSVVATCGTLHLGFQLVPGHGLAPGDAWLHPEDRYARERLGSISDSWRALIWFAEPIGDRTRTLSCRQEMARLRVGGRCAGPRLLISHRPRSTELDRSRTDGAATPARVVRAASMGAQQPLEEQEHRPPARLVSPRLDRAPGGDGGGRRAASARPQPAGGLRVRRDLVCAQRVPLRDRHAGVRHRPAGQPRAPAAGQLDDRGRHQGVRLRGVRLAHLGCRGRHDHGGPPLPPDLAAAAPRHAERPHLRRLHRRGPAGGRLPAHRPVADRDAGRVRHPVRGGGDPVRGARPRPATAAGLGAAPGRDPVGPDPASPVAVAGRHRARRSRGREVVRRLRGPGGDRPDRRLGDCRPAQRRAGCAAAQLESRHVAGHPRGAAAQRGAAGGGAGGGLPGRLHRADAGRAHRPAMAGRHGLAWHLGSPAGDAHLPYHPGGQPPLRVAAVVLAAAEAARRLLLQCQRRLPRDPGHRQSADLGGRRGRAWWCWRCSGRVAAGAWAARRPW